VISQTLELPRSRSLAPGDLALHEPAHALMISAAWTRRGRSMSYRGTKNVHDEVLETTILDDFAG
jgi:hypothetical protein